MARAMTGLSGQAAAQLAHDEGVLKEARIDLE
jgi:hypothetical protein